MKLFSYPFIQKYLIGLSWIQKKIAGYPIHSRRVALISCLFLLSLNLLSAQEANLDSLSAVLKTTKDNEVKLSILNEIVKTLSNINLDSAIVFARQGVKLADQVKSKKWQPQFYEMKGRIHANRLELDSASFYFDKAEGGYQSLGNKKGQASTYFKIAWVFKKRGELDKALEADLTALHIMEEIKDPLGIAGAYERVSNDVLDQGHQEEAVVYAKKAIEIARSNNLQQELVYAYTAAGAASLAMSNFQEAYTYFDQALMLAKKNGFDQMALSDFYNNHGNVQKRMHRYREALEDYSEALHLAEMTGYQNAINSVTANLGEVNLLMGNYQRALPYQLKTVSLMEASGDLPNLPESYTHLSTIYEKLHNFPMALNFQKKSRYLHDSIVSVESDKTMSELLTKYETVKKEATINEQIHTIQHQQRTQLLYVSLAALFGVITFGMYFTIKNIRKKRKALSLLNIALDTKNQQNELLLKEIHHRVKNNLEMVKSLIALQSAQMPDGSSKDAMLASQNRVQSMGIIHQRLYQGTNLGAIEMKDYFINLGEGVLDSFNAEDKVKIECAMEELNLDVDTAVPIGLIVNELLVNAIKYGFPERNSGQINISLKKENDNLLLNVSDNGVGKSKDAKPQGTGFGTQLIQLLTQQLNGTISEDNQNGTAVFFNFKNFKVA